MKENFVKESERTYHWENGASATFQDVIAIGVSESGTHYLNLGEEEKKVIVPVGWTYLTFKGPWSFFGDEL